MIDRRVKSSTGYPYPLRCNESISNCHGSVMYFTYLKRTKGTLNHHCYLSYSKIIYPTWPMMTGDKTGAHKAMSKSIFGHLLCFGMALGA